MHNDYVFEDQYSQGNYWGMLLSVDAMNCNPLKIRSSIYIEDYVKELIKKIEMVAFGKIQIYNFGSSEEVEGFSMIQLIETSLISGHFSNKYNNAFIDIFSCKWFDEQIVLEYTQDFFEAENIVSSVLLRG
jgi:S-adenosylmethionine/arginine decarboxylase-like enzyme